MWAFRGKSSNMARGIVARLKPNGPIRSNPWESWGVSLLGVAERGKGNEAWSTPEAHSILLTEVLNESGFLPKGQELDPKPHHQTTELQHPRLPFKATIFHAGQDNQGKARAEMFKVEYSPPAPTP
ncbi:MAG: hypothetical protein A3H88_02040 [Candidatus Blackburnbacteria bacterium RIFCSPLOWO2_02_FULL_44_9]|nr:MAG: hypothetical protein A3H88_02040 [Candidatus Blackburnbacteria bacterium RIFCSPLOWO2_02_FULL_44_9]